METACPIRRITLESGYAPVVAPVDCNYLMILNCGTQTIQRCSDPDNDQSWHDIPAGESYCLSAPRLGPIRFKEGDTVAYLQGPGTAVVEFIP